MEDSRGMGMAPNSGIMTGVATALSEDWRRILLRTLPCILLYAGLLVLENFAIARMDRWLPVDTMQTATNYSAMISSVSLWLRLCVVGMAVHRLLAPESDAEPALSGSRFLGFWCGVSLMLAASLLAVDLWRGGLQFRDPPLADDTLRWFWLASVYGQVILYYVGARVLFGAPGVGRGTGTSAWTATTTLRSLGLFLILLILNLTIGTVLVTVVSYIPVIAPFWFIPNELSEIRYFVGQGTRIFAESLGVPLYAVVWLALDRQTR